MWVLYNLVCYYIFKDLWITVSSSTQSLCQICESFRMKVVKNQKYQRKNYYMETNIWKCQNLKDFKENIVISTDVEYV